jgi:Zn-finger nucleic acid-binding protein
MQCPRCSMELVERAKVGVAVDACDRCRGVWLDCGELEKLLATLREGEQERALLQAERRARQGDGKANDRRKRDTWGRLLEQFE